jgi:hypothetical protein
LWVFADKIDEILTGAGESLRPLFLPFLDVGVTLRVTLKISAYF